MKNLQYNLDNMQTAIDNIGILRDEMDMKKDNLIVSLECIREDWQSGAGATFFSKLDNEWSMSIDECLALLDSFKTCLEEARNEYSKIEEEHSVEHLNV